MYYSIGDKLHLYVASDDIFQVEVEILGIINYEEAIKHEDIVRKIFNVSGINSKFDIIFNEAAGLQYYLCKVLSHIANFDEGDYIILTDGLIDLVNSYFLQEHFTMIAVVDYTTQNTSFRRRQQVVNYLKEKLQQANITNIEVKIDLSDEEKRQVEMSYYYNIILKLKELENVVPIVNVLKNINLPAISQEFMNNITTLQTIINNIVTQLNNP